MSLVSVVTVCDSTLELSSCEADGIAIFRLAPDASLLARQKGGWQPAAVPHTPLAVLLGWSDADLPLLQQARMRFLKDGGPHLPEILILDREPSCDGILIGVAKALSPFLVHQSRQVAQLAADLAAMRIGHEKMQQSFRGLEDFMLTRNVTMVEEAFVNDPEDLLKPPPVAGTHWRQLLPTPISRLSAIALHVARVDADTPGELNLSLASPELARTLCRWRVALRDLPIGWTVFGLPSTLGGVERSAVIDIAFDGLCGVFRLSTGGLNPLPAFRLEAMDGADSGSRSLALKTFVSPPGIRINHDSATIMPLDATRTAAPESGAEPVEAKAALRAPRSGNG